MSFRQILGRVPAEAIEHRWRFIWRDDLQTWGRLPLGRMHQYAILSLVGGLNKFHRSGVFFLNAPTFKYFY